MSYLGLIETIIRAVLGVVVFLIIPGYAMTVVAFRRGELDGIERMTLSIALSILVMPLIMLILNQTIKISIKATNVSIIIGLIIAYSYVILRYRAGVAPQ